MFEVKVICDSIAPCGKRLTTITSTFPRIILSEVNTHRDRCRNAASSRAIPFIKMSEAIQQDPFIPIAWGLEQSGMQAGDAIPPELAELAEQLWLQACESAQRYAKMIHNIGTTYNDLNTVQRQEFDETKIHKSIPNRLVEPWMWCTQVMSATEWNNFFRLRCHPDAEVHFQKIAGMIKDALAASTPIERNGKGEPESWHLPFILPEDWDWARTEAKDFVDTAMGMLKRISTARCARVSYLTHEGKRDPSKDLELFDRLVQGSGFGHWCYDDKTEVLTSFGWKSWKEVTTDDHLAAFHTDQSISFERPSAVTHEPYSGKMYELSGRSLSLCVTPDHRMYVASRRSGGSWTEFKIEKARDIYKQPRRYLTTGFATEGIEVNNQFGFSSNTFASLVGFFVGDGSAEQNSSDVIYFNLRRPRKIAYLLSLVPSAERLISGKWAVRGPGIAKWFRANCYQPDGQKKIPLEYIRATAKESAMLLEGLRNSDGTNVQGTWAYCTTSRLVKDQLQAILHLNGLGSSISITKKSKENYKWRDAYKISITTRTQSPRVETQQKGRTKTYKEEWVEYSGQIHCATVSTGLLVVRRDDKVVVSGNSAHEHIAEACDTLERSGPFIGWKQFRKEFVLENQAG